MSPWVRLVGSELNTRNGRGPPLRGRPEKAAGHVGGLDRATSPACAALLAGGLLRAIPTIAGIECGPWAGPGVRVYRLTRRELTIRPALSVTTSSNCPARSRTV